MLSITALCVDAFDDTRRFATRGESGGRREPSVVRIWGRDAEGRSCCVHVHGVRPYVYLRGVAPEVSPTELQALLEALMRARVLARQNAAARATEQRFGLPPPSVHSVEAQRRFPLYGVQGDAERTADRKVAFHKVTLTHTRAWREVIALLERGRGGEPPGGLPPALQWVQLYEAHVPILLQFMLDNEVHGMEPVSFSRWSERAALGPGPAAADLAIGAPAITELRRVAHSDSGGGGADFGRRERASICHREYDAAASDIVNPTLLRALTETVELGDDRRTPVVHSLAPFWKRLNEAKGGRRVAPAAAAVASPSQRHVPPLPPPPRRRLPAATTSVEMMERLEELIASAAADNSNADALDFIQNGLLGVSPSASVTASGMLRNPDAVLPLLHYISCESATHNLTLSLLPLTSLTEHSECVPSKRVAALRCVAVRRRSSGAGDAAYAERRAERRGQRQ